MIEILVLLIGLIAGLIGSMLGIGGGFLIVPLLVLALGIPMHLAASISLSSITMTSLSSTTVYARENMVDFKLGLLLEATTALGAILGSYIALTLDEKVLKILFGIVLSYAAYRMIVSRRVDTAGTSISRPRLAAGLLASVGAGAISGMLGIGGGTIKVPLMVLILGVPTKTAIATSAFMVGITASTAAIVYWSQGIYQPILVSILIIGIFVGAQIGSRLALRMKGMILRRFFGLVLLFFALRMLLSGLGVKL